MDEDRMDREIDEVLATVKMVERKMLEKEAFNEMKDIFAMHLAVIYASYSLGDALDFIKTMYEKEK